MDSCNPSSKRADSQHGRMRWEKRDRNFQFCGRSAWSGEKFDSFTTLWKSEVWPAETSSLAWCNGSSIWFWSFGTCFELNLNRVLKLRFASLKIVEKKKKLNFSTFDWRVSLGYVSSILSFLSSMLSELGGQG